MSLISYVLNTHRNTPVIYKEMPKVIYSLDIYSILI